MNPFVNELNCIVFRTNLQTPSDVESISETLNQIEGIRDWSVDLEDWEKVLRIEGTGLDSSAIRNILFEKGVMIGEMPVD